MMPQTKKLILSLIPRRLSSSCQTTSINIPFEITTTTLNLMLELHGYVTIMVDKHIFDQYYYQY